ncbi:Cell differentiation protein RCD1 [Rhynchospora pubera]|uniref:Cell differentiation protein RCD1 n=1 Tax=Rhynchospora pubera TaxID=906938 RepID=A0AAV8D4H2_9POAL|nr:Cell differentiation protein RCD1 [Rhynchospora pubera]
MSPVGTPVWVSPNGRVRITAPPGRRIPGVVPSLEELLEDVFDPIKRGPALVYLAMKRRTVQDYSLIIWNTPGFVALILQEILRIYPYIDHEEQIPDDDCLRVSCAISLFQPVAKDSRVRVRFLRAETHRYLYPFLNTPKKSTNFDKLRLTSLGIIGFLVKEVDLEAVNFLLQSEVIPICLHCIEVGTDWCRIAAVFILQKILSTDIGMQYTCVPQERFVEINRVLSSLFTLTRNRPSSRLLRRVIYCFYLFSCNERVANSLYGLLPDALKDESFVYMFRDSVETVNFVRQVLWNTTRIYNRYDHLGMIPEPDDTTGLY